MGKKLTKRKMVLCWWEKQFRLAQNNKPSGLENVCSDLCNISFDSENFGENEDKKTPDLEEYSLAVESQTNEEYTTRNMPWFF